MASPPHCRELEVVPEALPPATDLVIRREPGLKQIHVSYRINYQTSDILMYLIQLNFILKKIELLITCSYWLIPSCFSLNLLLQNMQQQYKNLKFS